MDNFDKAVKQVFNDERTHSIPALFIIQVLVVIDDLNLLKEDITDEYAVWNE